MHIYLQTTIILVSTVFWFIIDTISLFTNKKIINSALIHSLITGIGVQLGYMYQPSIIYHYKVDEELHDIYLLFPLLSFGYAFYDLYIGIKSKNIGNIIHGILFVLGILLSLINNHILLSYPGLLTEISSIFLNLRPLKYNIIDILFVITFFVYRLIVMPTLLVIYLTDTTNSSQIIVYTISIFLTILNIYWFVLIIKKVIKNYVQQPKININ